MNELHDMFHNYPPTHLCNEQPLPDYGNDIPVAVLN